MYLDYGSEHKDVIGTLFDSSRYFNIKTYDWDQWAPHCSSGEVSGVVEYEEVATMLTVYGYAFAHVTVEQIPQFLYLLKSIPAHIPILVQDGAMRQYVWMLGKAGLVNETRIEWYYPQKQLIYAKQVYFLAEDPVCGERHGQLRGGLMWQAPELMQAARQTFHKAEIGLNQGNGALKPWLERWRVNEGDLKSRFKLKEQHHIWDRLVSAPSTTDFILVADRPFSPMRKLSNILDILAVMKLTFPSLADRIVYFAADELPLEVVVSLFKRVKMLICPHGATLGHMMWMSTDSTVVELAYTGNASMAFPGSYYYTVAVALGLTYAVVPAQGEYNTEMKADVSKLLDVVKPILKRLQ
jgi:hypothetical protein